MRLEKNNAAEGIAPQQHAIQGCLSLKTWLALEKENTNVHRIFSSSSVWIERYGDDVLLSRFTRVAWEGLMDELKRWGEEISFAPRRVFLRDLVKNPDTKHTPILLQGPNDLPLTTAIQERGISYHADFGGYSVGFFLDQRMNRQHVRDLKPKKFLNCFAYTCSFSVAAALEGAETTSADISRQALRRGQSNFELNHLSPQNHHFIVEDVRKLLPRLAKRNERFDAIILDPPTFARSEKGRPLQIERDLPELIRMTLACAAPEAHILLSSNCQTLPTSQLIHIARNVLKETNRRASFHTESTPPDVPEWAMPANVWACL
ncbi:MAG: class I SAM-dependent methyltransferase [bacterium]